MIDTGSSRQSTFLSSSSQSRATRVDSRRAVSDASSTLLSLSLSLDSREFASDARRSRRKTCDSRRRLPKKGGGQVTRGELARRATLILSANSRRPPIPRLLRPALIAIYALVFPQWRASAPPQRGNYTKVPPRGGRRRKATARRHGPVDAQCAGETTKTTNPSSPVGERLKGLRRQRTLCNCCPGPRWPRLYPRAIPDDGLLPLSLFVSLPLALSSSSSWPRSSSRWWSWLDNHPVYYQVLQTFKI